MHRALHHILLLGLILCSSLSSSAQTWENAYVVGQGYQPDGVITSIALGPDQSIYATMRADNLPETFLLRANANGQAMQGLTVQDISISTVPFNQGLTITADSTVFVVGLQGESNLPTYNDCYVVRTDLNGNFLGSRKWGIPNVNEELYGITQSASGHRLAVGYSDLYGSANNESVYLTGLDENADTLWTRLDHRSGTRRIGFQIDTCSNGGFFVSALNHGPSQIDSLYVLRVDTLGNTLWSKTYSIEGIAAPNFISAATNGQAITGMGSTVYLLTDQGDTVWRYSNPDLFFSGGVQAPDGNFVLTGSKDNAIFCIKLSATGQLMWLRTEYHEAFGQLPNHKSTRTIANGPNNSILLGGAAGANTLPILIKTDADGFVVKQRIEGQLYHDLNANCTQDFAEPDMDNIWQVIVRKDSQMYSLPTDSAGNFALMVDTGHYVFDFVAPSSPSAWSLPPCGYTDTTKIGLNDSIYRKIGAATSYVHGLAFLDTNYNCTHDPGEPTLPNAILTINGALTYIAVTDANGEYLMQVDTGTYSISPTLNNPNWDWLCYGGNPQIVSVNHTNDTVWLEFPISIVHDCPSMVVDVSTNVVRHCGDGVPETRYTVNYWNLGTMAAPNSSVEVVIDPYYTFISSTGPPVSIVDSLLTFDLGTVPIGATGSFTFDVELDCQALEGQTHCAVAHIYPDSACYDFDTAWDASSIEVEALCITDDSIRVNIRNAGIGNMLDWGTYIVTEEDILLNNDSVILPSGGTETFYLEARGTTYNIFAEQAPGHPWSISPVSVSVEGCGTNDLGQITTGLVNNAPEYDDFPYESEDCQESTSNFTRSSGPQNSGLRTYPRGFTTDHLIDEHQAIEYLITFRNDFPDTLHSLVIRDTISPHLDLYSLIPGASSHPYTWTIADTNVAVFTFNKLLIPDSSAALPDREGFLKFKINQTPFNHDGTVITNRAHLYYDQQAPIQTVEVFHTIGKWQVILVVPNEEAAQFGLSVFPNPFSENATFVMDDGMPFELRIYDLAGRLQLSESSNAQGKCNIPADRFSDGYYVYEVHRRDGRRLGGKIIVSH